MQPCCKDKFVYLINICLSLFLQNLKTMSIPHFNYMQQMDIVIRMETALAGEGNMVVYMLKNAIRTKQPTSLIIKETKEMIRDNYNAIAGILGTQLTDTIKNFEL